MGRLAAAVNAGVVCETMRPLVGCTTRLLTVTPCCDPASPDRRRSSWRSQTGSTRFSNCQSTPSVQGGVVSEPVQW